MNIAVFASHGGSDMQAIIDDIMVGIPDKTNVYSHTDRKEAIRLAMELAQKDDIV